MKRETRTLFCDLAQATVETRQDGDNEIPMAVGYAAVYYDGGEGSEFRLWEDYVERIEAGAFDEVLNDDVRGLFNHDVNMILGRSTAKTLRLSSDDKGLRYEIDLPDTQAGRDLRVSLDRRDITGSSFSFIIDTDDGGETVVEEKEGMYIRTIKKVSDLLDVGPVTFPAYEGTEANARDVETARHEVERFKRERDGVSASAIDMGLTLAEKKLSMNT